jgi:hypothetical protein
LSSPRSYQPSKIHVFYKTELDVLNRSQEAPARDEQFSGILRAGITSTITLGYFVKEDRESLGRGVPYIFPTPESITYVPKVPFHHAVLGGNSFKNKRSASVAFLDREGEEIFSFVSLWTESLDSMPSGTAFTLKDTD